MTLSQQEARRLALKQFDYQNRPSNDPQPGQAVARTLTAEQQQLINAWNNCSAQVARLTAAAMWFWNQGCEQDARDVEITRDAALEALHVIEGKMNQS